MMVGYRIPDPQEQRARKGVASYFDVVVEGETNRGAAWYYPNPKAAAANIKDLVAFWRGVKLEA